MSATVLDASNRLRRLLSAACLVVLAAAEIKAGDDAGGKATVSKQKLYEAALLSLKDKDHDGAIMLFEMCLKSLPDDADCHRGMGLALQEKKDLPAALTHFMRAVRMGPEDAQNHYHLGILRGKMRDWAASATAMAEAVRLKPNEPEYNYFLGAGLFQSGRKVEAGKHFKKACRLGWEQACEFLKEFPAAIGSGASGPGTISTPPPGAVRIPGPGSRKAPPPAAPPAPPSDEELKVDGIMWASDGSSAIVNDKMVRVGDTVAGAVILKITADCVTYRRGGQTREACVK